MDLTWDQFVAKIPTWELLVLLKMTRRKPLSRAGKAHKDSNSEWQATGSMN